MMWTRQRSSLTVVSSLVALWISASPSSAFQPAPAFCRGTLLYSSVGDGSTPPPPDDEGGDKGWDDFLNPDNEESENLKKAREYISENSLPISFDGVEPNGEDATENPFVDTNSSALVGPSTLFQGGPSEEALARNPYMAVVSKLTPSELISKFTSTAHPRVQNAVRSTILGLIGGLPKMAFDTTTITTGQRLASLMFQLQMTGYMFKNAEYRLSIQQSLGVDGKQIDSSLFLLPGFEDEEENNKDPLVGKPRGKLRIRYGGTQSEDEEVDPGEEESESSGLEMEVDAEAFTSELRAEVAKLRDELMITRKEKDEALRKDLLTYIRTLPEQELRSLTNTMSQDVLVAMKGLVNAVMAGLGDGEIGPDTVTEQSGESMAQLCMWQLVIGYNLRTLEVREEMKKSLSGSLNTSSSGEDESSAAGAFE